MNLIRHFAIAATVLAVMVGLTGICYAQEDALTIKDILASAECPLTEAQAKTLSSFKIGGDPSVFAEMATLFDEKQTAALMDTFGSSPGFGGGPEQPRMLFFAIIFENEECPFSAEQVAKIKELPNDESMFMEMQDIFNEKQGAVMQSMMP